MIVLERILFHLGYFLLFFIPPHILVNSIITSLHVPISNSEKINCSSNHCEALERRRLGAGRNGGKELTKRGREERRERGE